MKLWGKTMAELDEDHRRMLVDREQRGMSPAELAAKYATSTPVFVRQEAAYHFGTDIAAPSWEEVEMARARRGEDESPNDRRLTIIVLGVCASVLVVSVLVVALARELAEIIHPG